MEKISLAVGIKVVDYGRLEGLRSSAVNCRLSSGPRWVPDPTAVTTAPAMMQRVHFQSRDGGLPLISK